jgi:general nucleoside transport system ATP-binding protein
VSDLGSAERQKLEIIRTLAHNAKVLILDEPTAVLTARDTAELFVHLKKFARAGGAVVLITHKLADALAHADDVTVLRKGRLVLSAPMSEVNENVVAEAMIGSVLSRPSGETVRALANSPPVASLVNAVLDKNRDTAGVTLDIKPGEILGVAALDGAATPLLRVLARRVPVASGDAQLPSSVGFVPENRRDEALIGEFSLTENFALGDITEQRGVMDWPALAQKAAQILTDFAVQATSVDDSPDRLSGGNQQRFVLGRELADDPQLLVLENPTQGLDINAASFIHQRLRQSRNDGAAVVFYSSDLDELAELSDRVLVVSDKGLIIVTPDRSEIGAALLGTQKTDAA